MNVKKTTKWLTSIIVIVTFALLICYITLMSIDAEKYSGWLQILSIAIQLLASFIGVFLALRMSQLISDQEAKVKVKKLWERIGNFLEQLKKGIEDGKGLIELSDYKSYWLSVQNASYESAKVLHEDECYLKISGVFSFLSYHESEWSSKTHSIEKWKQNSGTNLRNQIEEWQKKIDEILVYVNTKVKK